MLNYIVVIIVDDLRKTPAIDMDILSTMQMKETVGYAPNPNNRKRNQVINFFVQYCY